VSARWGLAAEFYHYDKGEDAYTFYDEVSFPSYEKAREAVDTEYGENIVASAQIDIENEADLQGFNFEGVAPYLIEGDDEDLS